MPDRSYQPFVVTSRVEFSDTDAAGLMHFSTYFRFMEKAEAAFFRSLQIPLLSLTNSDRTGFPRIRVDCRFSKPLHFEDEVEIHLHVSEVIKNRIAYNFVFYRHSNGENTKTARGSMETAFVKRTDSGDLESIELPSDWKDKFETILKS